MRAKATASVIEAVALDGGYLGADLDNVDDALDSGRWRRSWVVAQCPH
jgi:hypothetical protein